MRLREYLTLGITIIGPLPNNIQNGQVEDAVPVMANFNWIVSQVNANVAASLPVNVSSIPTYCGAAGGTANTLTLAPSPAISAYAAGQRFSFLASATNTGAATVNVSGLGAKDIDYPDGTLMTGREITVNGIYDIEYNGTVFILMNSSQTSGLQTFTPGVAFGGGATGITYAVQLGNYIKIGRMVFFSLDVLLTNKGSSTGSATITGLPYTINSAWPSGGFNSLPVRFKDVGFTTGVDCYAIAYYVSGSTTLGLSTVQTGTTALQLSNTSFANSSEIAITGFYPV